MSTVRPLFQMICCGYRKPIRSNPFEHFAREYAGVPDIGDLQAGHQFECF